MIDYWDTMLIIWASSSIIYGLIYIGYILDGGK